MRTRTIVLTLVSMIAAVTTALSQESPLGSPSDIRGKYSTNYAEVVRAALPKADMATLNKAFASIRVTSSAAKPLSITDPRQLERMFGLRERGEADASGYFETGEAAYKVDPIQQRIYLVRRYSDIRRIPRKEFQGELSAIRTAHQQLAERLGIQRNEVLFTDVREVLSETDGHPELEKGVKGEIMAEGAVTTMLRAVGGVLVEGSFVRMSSVDAKRLDLLDVRWPRIRLSEQSLGAGLRAPQEALPSIIRRVSADSKGQAISVRMAIVLRPVRSARTIEFVPSLKVGVEPQTIKAEGGYRTDAGEVFYVDLVKGAPQFADVPASDTARSRGTD